MHVARPPAGAVRRATGYAQGRGRRRAAAGGVRARRHQEADAGHQGEGASDGPGDATLAVHSRLRDVRPPAHRRREQERPRPAASRDRRPRLRRGDGQGARQLHHRADRRVRPRDDPLRGRRARSGASAPVRRPALRHRQVGDGTGRRRHRLVARAALDAGGAGAGSPRPVDAGGEAGRLRGRCRHVRLLRGNGAASRLGAPRARDRAGEHVGIGERHRGRLRSEQPASRSHRRRRPRSRHGGTRVRRARRAGVRLLAAGRDRDGRRSELAKPGSQAGLRRQGRAWAGGLRTGR